jgi:hypothetical protein
MKVRCAKHSNTNYIFHYQLITNKKGGGVVKVTRSIYYPYKQLPVIQTTDANGMELRIFFFFFQLQE